MATELTPVDIGAMPELIRLVEEVRASGHPRRLRRAGEDVALLVPAPSAPKRRAKRTPARTGREAFRLPKGSAVAATAGIVRYDGPPLSIDEERAAFEQGVADEAAESMGG